MPRKTRRNSGYSFRDDNRVKFLYAAEAYLEARVGRLPVPDDVDYFGKLFDNALRASEVTFLDYVRGLVNESTEANTAKERKLAAEMAYALVSARIQRLGWD
jgi:hypothetical protein